MKIDAVVLLSYNSIRRDIDFRGKKGAIEFIISVGSKMNLSKFYSPKYQNASDKEFAWEFLRSNSEFLEDSKALKGIEKLKKYEKDNNVDLYELYPEGEFK